MDIFWLPRELVGEVTASLDTTSTHCLRGTCKTFRDQVAVRPPTHLWLEVCDHVPVHIKDSRILVTLYQAMWDEHSSMLAKYERLWRPGSAPATELYRQLRYVSAMRGSTSDWSRALWDQYQINEQFFIYRAQCITVAMGFCRQAFLRDVLKVDDQAQREHMVNYDFLENNQDPTHIECPDPILLLLRNGHLEELERWRARLTHLHGFRHRYVTWCLVEGRPDLIPPETSIDASRVLHLVEKIFDQSQSTAGLDWVLARGADVEWFRCFHHVVGLQEPSRVYMWMVWMLHHEVLPLDCLYDILRQVSDPMIIRYVRWLARHVSHAKEKPAWATEIVLKTIVEISGLSPQELE